MVEICVIKRCKEREGFSLFDTFHYVRCWMCSINNEIDYIICGIEIIKLEMDFIIMEENTKLETGYNAEWCMSRIEEIVLAEYILYQY